MNPLARREVEEEARSGSGLTWPDVVVRAIELLTEKERSNLRIPPGQDEAKRWFAQHRPRFDTWRKRYKIPAWRTEPGSHPRFHPGTINLVAILLSRQDLGPAEVRLQPQYREWEQYLNSRVGHAAPEPTRRWFSTLERLEERHHLAEQFFRDRTREEGWSELSQSLCQDWPASQATSNDDKGLERIAWEGIRTLIEHIGNPELKDWLSRIESEPRSFGVLAGAYYTLVTDVAVRDPQVLSDLSPKLLQLLQVMFPWSLHVLQEGRIDLGTSDVLFLSWTARIRSPSVSGAIGLAHLEAPENSVANGPRGTGSSGRPLYYERAEDLALPEAKRIESALSLLFRTPRVSGEVQDESGATLRSLRGQREISVRATYLSSGKVRLVVDSPTGNALDLWQVRAMQRVRWLPRGNAVIDPTTDWFISDLEASEDAIRGLRLKQTYNDLQFVTIPSGQYTIGDRLETGTRDERPAHSVELSEYAISVMPVTFGMYRRFMQDVPEWAVGGDEANRCASEEPVKGHALNYLRDLQEMDRLAEQVAGAAKGETAKDEGLLRDDLVVQGRKLLGFDSLPVFAIPWWAAAAYCNWLSGCFGLAPVYVRTSAGSWKRDAGGDGFRLPTEAEWEVAASCGGRYVYGLGDRPEPMRYTWRGNLGPSLKETAADALAELEKRPRKEPESGNSRKNSDSCHVRSWWAHGPSAFGLYQMLGNVWEWTEDVYAADTYLLRSRSAEPVRDPCRDPDAATRGMPVRVIRGGSFATGEHTLRTTKRHQSPEARCHFIGFRVARGVGSLSKS